jgi:starch synthase
VGGLPELVAHGETGMLVPPQQPAALASAIESLLADDETRRRYGINGKRLLETSLSWERVAQQSLEAYAQA